MRPSRARATLVATLALTMLAVAGVRVAQQQPTFRTGVEVVAIDVNVVGAQGRPVEELTPEDFTVTVDRKPRKIVSAQYINHGVRLARTGGKAAGGASVLDALSAPPPRQTGRNVMIVIDADSLEAGTGLMAIRAARGFLDQLPAVDRVGVATIPRLPSSLSFMTDRAEARKLLDRVITAPPEMPTGEHRVGLQEAYDIERSDQGIVTAVVARECKCGYPPEGFASASGGNLAPCTGEQIEMCVVPLVAYAHQLALAGHMQAQRSLDALRDLAQILAQVQGPKTLVFVSGGLGIPETSASFDPLEPALANGQVTLYTLYIERMSLGQVKDSLSPSFVADDRLDMYGVENITEAAGGTLVHVVGQIESAFERVAVEMSGSYLLGIEVEASDRDGKPHGVQVKVNRPDVQIRARRQYVIEPEKPSTKRAEAAPAAPLSAAERAARRAEGAAPLIPDLDAVTLELVALLTRVSDFVMDYGTRIAALACDEQYDQTLSKWKTGPVLVKGVIQNKEDWFIDKRRHMKSDYVLVKGAGPTGWLQFRDPFEVDGSAVGPRTGRLAKLFAETPTTALQRAAQIMTENARYNIGFGERNMDVPTLALVLLEPANRARFFFRKEGEVQVEGTPAWQVAYTERGSPTIFVGDRNENLPLEGTFWIEPEQGRVIKSTVRLNMEVTDAEITVTYRPSAELGGLWVPTEVRETYASDTQKLECLARYSNFRRLQSGGSEK
jgi:VWFA-related protein